MQRVWVGCLAWLVCIAFQPNWTGSGKPKTATATLLHSLPDESKDSLFFVQKLRIAQAQKGTSAQVMAVAQSFLGTPYQHGTLEGASSEHLVVNLSGLDCWTFVENCLATALCTSDSQASFDTYKNHLRTLRYWGGTVNGYGSRIHYFTGWILQAEKLGFIRDLTKDLGGVELHKKVSFITDNPHLYPKLKDTTAKQKVFVAQKRIDAHPWYFIPKAKIAAMEANIQDGDIVVLTSSKKNLDVEHQGFAIRQADGKVHLLHASSTFKKVMIATRPLAEYVTRIPSMSGIMVCRPE